MKSRPSWILHFLCKWKRSYGLRSSINIEPFWGDVWPPSVTHLWGGPEARWRPQFRDTGGEENTRKTCKSHPAKPQSLHLLSLRQRCKPASRRAVQAQTETINEKEKQGEADGDLWSTLQAISSPLPWSAAPTRAGGVPQGEALCGYHTPSSGCRGVKCQQQLPQPHWPAYLLSQQHGQDRLTDRQANRQTFAEGMTCRSWNIIGIQMKR